MRYSLEVKKVGTNIDTSIAVQAGFLTLVGMGTAVLLLLSLILFIKLNEIITKRVEMRRTVAHSDAPILMDVKDQMVAASVAVAVLATQADGSTRDEG